MFTDIENKTQYKSNEDNFSYKINYKNIHILLNNLHPTTRKTAVVPTLNNTKIVLKKSSGTNIDAQATPKVTCDKAIKACPQNSLSLLVNLLAIFSRYPLLVLLSMMDDSHKTLLERKFVMASKIIPSL